MGRTTDYEMQLNRELHEAFDEWNDAENKTSIDVLLDRIIERAIDLRKYHALYNAGFPLQDIKRHTEEVRKYRAVEMRSGI